jgi:predicted phage terminase large subunit-like protein
MVGRHHKRLAKIFEDIAAGKKKRVIVNIAPRHGKSELISYLAPAWFLGKYPHKKVIMASHTADLAVNFGRRVRNLVSSDLYNDVFPQVELQSDSKSASRWGTNFNGEYFAIGVGGALAGRGADLFIIDDPHSEQEAKQGTPHVFEPAWEWFQSGPLQRLMPGGAIIVVMCMTGDTGVLRPDGSETPLKDIRPGDEIATYEDGGITTSQVLNHQSNGIDTIYQVQTQYGRILRANERHPFLVDIDGEQQWIKLKDLKPGMLLVALKGAIDLRDHKPSPDYAPPAKPQRRTTRSTLTHLMNRLGIMGNCGVKPVHTVDVQNQLKLKSFARHTTIKHAGQRGIAGITIPRSIVAQNVLSTDTVSAKKSLIAWLQNAVTAVMSVVNHHLVKIHALTGMGSSVSTIVTIPDRSGGSSVTTVTSQLGMGKHLRSCDSLLNTYSVTLDEITAILPDGQAEVFDIQIERTENFIANGVVSHNTRWSKMDLTGQIIDHMTRNNDADEWEVVEFPAILNDKPLWPDFWPLEELLAKKAGMDPRYWQAQYMQQPTSEQGALIKREWWQIWEKEDPPKCDFIIMALDAAQETNNRADYNALTTWGIFFNEETSNHNIILLNAIKKRLEFPELKAMVLEEYKEWEPDAFIVEKKSNGAALYQEMRRMGIPLGEFTPGKGQDKVSRVNAVSDLFSSGIVWAPDRRWAREVMEECNDFPAGRNDDLVDSTTLALMRFRQGGFITLPSDEVDLPYQYAPRKAAYY